MHISQNNMLAHNSEKAMLAQLVEFHKFLVESTFQMDYILVLSV